MIEGNKKIIMNDDFEQKELDTNYWIPTYLPQWSSREKTIPSYRIENSILTLYISDEQQAWCPEWNGKVRVSNLQTGIYFTEGLIVREEQERKYTVTPQYCILEFKARCHISKENVAALWLIGIEEEKHQSAEICLFEMKGWNINEAGSIIGYGVHPFGDYKIKDEFYEEQYRIDVAEWNVYRLDWTKERIQFYFNDNLVKTIEQSPDYPMQLMLNLYDLHHIKNEMNTFEIDYVKIYQS